MHYLPEQTLITCILPKGTSLPLLPRIKHELGILTAHLNSARGFGRSAQGNDSSPAQSEKELLTVITPGARADEVFNWLFEVAGINQPGGGLIYMTTLKGATAFSVPDNLQEESE